MLGKVQCRPAIRGPVDPVGCLLCEDVQEELSVARIILDTPTKSSTLPASCVVGEAKGGTGDVYVIKNGKAKKMRVEIGADDGIRVEIHSGLSPDDEVILNTGSVTGGMPVRSIRDAEKSKASNEKTSDYKEEPSHAR